MPEKAGTFYSYSVNVTVKKEEKVYKDACRRLGKANVLLTEKTEYLFPAEGSTQQKHPTVIIGMGPAGLFADIIWHSTAMHLSFWNGVQTWMPDRRM